MNVRKIGIGALIVLAPLFTACEKAAEKGVKATEKISIKDGKKFLSKETVELFRERYSPIDTLKISDDMSNAVKDSLSRDTIAVKKKGGTSIRTGVNSQDKPFIVYTSNSSREAIQLTEGGGYEKSTFFDSKDETNPVTVTWNLNSNGTEGNNWVAHRKDKMTMISIGENEFIVSSGKDSLNGE